MSACFVTIKISKKYFYYFDFKEYEMFNLFVITNYYK